VYKTVVLNVKSNLKEILFWNNGRRSKGELLPRLREFGNSGKSKQPDCRLITFEVSEVFFLTQGYQISGFKGNV